MRALCRVVWFWAALAFVVGCIMPSVLTSRDGLFYWPGRWISRDDNFVTVLCSVSWRVREDIVIISPAPYEDPASPSYARNQLFSANSEDEASDPTLGSDEGPRCRPLVQIREVEVRGYIAVENSYAGMRHHMRCECIASILQSKAHINTLKVSFQRLPHKEDRSNGDVCAFCCNHRFLNNCNMGVHFSRLSDTASPSYDPKPDRRNGQNKSEECDRITGSTVIRCYEPLPNGFAFILLMVSIIGGFVLALVLSCVQRWLDWRKRR